MEQEQPSLCRRLERGQGKAISEKTTILFACLFPQITTSRVSFSSAKFSVPENPSPACQPALHWADTTQCHVTVNWKNAKPKTGPQSDTQADSSRWQILTHSDPLSKWQHGSRCFVKATVITPHSALINTAAVYLLCCFELCDKVQQRNFTWTPALWGIRCMQALWSTQKERRHQESMHKSTGSKGLPSWALCWLLQATATGSNNNNQVKRVCHITV